MVRPPAKHQGRLVDVDFASFINDFLFNSGSNRTSTATSLRSVRRYKSMWRAAAKAVIAKKKSTSQEVHLSLEDPLFKNLPSAVSIVPPLLDHARDRATNDVQEPIRVNCVIDVAEAAFPVPAARDFSMNLSHQAPSACIPPQNSSRKPPRPLKCDGLRSSSYRAFRLKGAKKRAMTESQGKRNTLPSSSSNGLVVMWAVIISTCFVFIMLLQVFCGEDCWQSLPSAGQQVGGSLSPS